MGSVKLTVTSMRASRARWMMRAGALCCAIMLGRPAFGVRMGASVQRVSVGGMVGSNVIFVRATAEGALDGTSWQDAFIDLQDALGIAAAGDVIWVAAGTYRPGQTRAATFPLQDEVPIYGGFAGVEDPSTVDLSDRDFAANETILTGVIESQSPGVRVYHVVTADGTSRSAVLDGFTITGGYADGLSPTRQDVGGGLLVVNGAPTIRNCTFVSNRALTKGGAVHLSFASSLFVSCRFVRNETTVTQQAANFGGAVYSEGDVLPGGPPTFINCLFVGNHAGVGSGGHGGALYATPGNRPVLVNCTFSANRADSTAGGIWGAARITSGVLWANVDGGSGLRSAQITGSATVTYSCVQGGWTGVGNVEDDPLFVDAFGADGEAGTRDDDLSPAAGSPAIDAGDSSAVPVEIDRDLARQPRFVNDPVTEDTGVPGFAAVVDMGAFEYQATCHSDDACLDGRTCNGIEVCAAGLCQSGTPVDCDDGIACTIDVCDDQTGACAHIPDHSLCTNESYCDGTETCNLESGCVVGTHIDCDDGIPCTIDACNEETRSCSHEPDDARCDNGLLCDGVERCDVAGGCRSPAPIVCDDGVDCTIDRCDDQNGACLHLVDDTYCDNGVFCDGEEACDAVRGCMSSVSPCTDTVCDEAQGRCVDCLDDADCDDGVDCTQDTCDRRPGNCTFAPDDARCDDFDACTTDRCDAAGCVFEPITECCTGDAQCDDGNPCTDDLCEAGRCVIHNNNTACDDDDACTRNDTCAGGACSGTRSPNCGGPDDVPEPSDADDDGVDDELDACPNTPTGETVDDAGCPCTQRDGDDDGFNDCDDGCPADPEKSAPGICGCGVAEADEDRDGVADCVDQCPDTVTGVTVNSDGCLLAPKPGQPAPQPDPSDEPPGDTVADTDSDGVPDEIDVCPDSPTDIDVDADGCPIIPDDPAGAGAGRGSVCGVCGSVGLMPWTIVVLGMGLVRSRRRRYLPCGPVSCFIRSTTT